MDSESITKSPAVAQDFEERTPEEIAEEKKLVRKIDLFLLPIIWIMYLFSYADRTK
jgi:hypothetical protein